jgi:transcriptional/translational regulatory protein YebC/TACO1
VQLDAEQTLSVIKLLDALEDLDDVQAVYHNAAL